MLHEFLYLGHLGHPNAALALHFTMLTPYAAVVCPASTVLAVEERGSRVLVCSQWSRKQNIPINPAICPSK